MPDKDSPQITIERLESHLNEVSKGLDDLDKEVRAVLKQWGKKTSEPAESETPAPGEKPGNAATSDKAA